MRYPYGHCQGFIPFYQQFPSADFATLQDEGQDEDEGRSDEASKGRKQEQEHQNETNMWIFIVRVQTQENNKSWFSPLYGDLAAKLANKC